MKFCCRISNRFCCPATLLISAFALKLLIGVAIALFTMSSAQAASSSPSYAIGDTRAFAKVVRQEEEKQLEPATSSVPKPQPSEFDLALQRAVDTYVKLVVDCRLTEMGPAHELYHERNEADLLAQILHPASYYIDEIPFVAIRQGNNLTADQYKKLLEKGLVHVEARDQGVLVPNLIDRHNLSIKDIEEIKIKLHQLNAQLMQLRANCSTLEIYMTEAGKEADKFMRSLKCGHRLAGIIGEWRTNKNSGFTPLMRAAARGNREFVEVLIAQKANLFKKTRLLSAFVNKKIKVNEQEFEASMQKDIVRTGPILQPLSTNQSLDVLLEDIWRMPEHPLYHLMTETDALSLAALGGHEEVVDQLLDAMIDDLHHNGQATQEKINRVESTIKSALFSLVYYSEIIKSNCINEILHLLGIPERPNLEHYDAIAKKLFQAALRIYYLPDDGRYRVGTDHEMQRLLVTAMQYGSPEMLRVIAESLAQTQVAVRWDYSFGFYQNGRVMRDIFEHLILTTKSGEKLGILLSINSIPNSLVYQLGQGMLQYMEANPKMNAQFLKRLKGYLREQENALMNLNGEIGEQLIPDLAGIVEEYADPHRIPDPLARRILAIDAPPAPKQPVEEKKEREQPSSSSTTQTRMAAQLNQAKRQMLIDQLTELQTVANKHKLERAKTPILHALQLIKTQPYTKDVIALAKMLVTVIDPKPKIEYSGKATVNFLLEPIVSGLTREINRLQQG